MFSGDVWWQYGADDLNCDQTEYCGTMPAMRMLIMLGYSRIEISFAGMHIQLYIWNINLSNFFMLIGVTYHMHDFYEYDILTNDFLN